MIGLRTVFVTGAQRKKVGEMGAQVLRFEQTFEHVADCGSCGVPIIMSAQRVRSLKESHETFYCSNGHARHWPAKSDAEIAHEKLAEERKASDALRVRLMAEEKRAKAAETALAEERQRVANGVCPCCKRSFANLRRHMATKHPDEASRSSRPATGEKR